MSFSAPGHVLRGAKWGYRIVKAIKGEKTHASAIFKARVSSRERASNAPEWAVIKKARTGRVAAEHLERECRSYRLPGVADATCFRELYAVIDKRTIALEWLDTTLAHVKYRPNTRSYNIIKAVLKETLTSCVVLDRQQHMNTDYKPSNILLSGVGTDCITAKVGNLGLVVPDGSLRNCQPYAVRAPEVLLGQPCTKSSQVWAIAALLLCWIKPGILGVWDCPDPLINEAWCIAKLKSLFPGWHIPTAEHVERPTRKDELKSAIESAFISRDEKGPRSIAPFEEEIKRLKIPDQLRDLLRLMLVVDPRERLSASAVLESKEFEAFQIL